MVPLILSFKSLKVSGNTLYNFLRSGNCLLSFAFITSNILLLESSKKCDILFFFNASIFALVSATCIYFLSFPSISFLISLSKLSYSSKLFVIINTSSNLLVFFL
jgi:hypothetical protein